MDLTSRLLGRRLRRKERRALWIALGAIGIGLVALAAVFSLDTDTPPPRGLFVAGVILIAIAAVRYGLLSTKWRRRKRRRRRRHST